MFKRLFKFVTLFLIFAGVTITSLSQAQFTGPSFTPTTGGVSPWIDMGSYIYFDKGDVGVGDEYSTLPPNSRFHLRGTDSNGSTFIIQRSEDLPTGPSLWLRKSRNTILGPAATLGGDPIGQIAFGGYDGNSWAGSSFVLGTATEPWTAAAKGSALTFRTTANGTSAWVDRMRIDHNGNVIVGPTNTLYVDVNFGRVGINTVPASNFHVQGNVQISGGEILQDSWSAATFQNGWANAGGIRTDASYMKDRQGFIHLKGEVSGGTITDGTVIFQLPFGYRPNETFENPIVYDDGTGSRVIGSLQIDSVGDCRIYTVSSNTRLSLGMIIFRQNL